MRVFFIINSFLLVLIFGSCSTSYYYSTMDSKDPYINKTDKSEFVVQGDSLDITYSFHGENSPITIGINNKMSRSVYADWRQSGIYLGDRFTAFSDPYLYRDIENDTIFVSYERIIEDMDGMTTILPNNKKDKKVIELTNFKFHKIANSKYHISKSEIDSIPKKRRQIEYDETDSPILIHTYLIIYPGGKQLATPLVYENDFYMSSLIKGNGTSPKDITAYAKQQGNLFYTKHKNGKAFRKIGKGTLKVLGVTAKIAADVTVATLLSDEE